MKKIAIATLALFSVLVTWGKYSPDDAKINDIKISRNGGTFFVGMDMDMRAVDIKPNQEWTVTPVIRNGASEVRLQPVTFAGRNRWYNRVRRSGESEWLLRAGKSARKEYVVNVPYESWMNNAFVEMEYEVDGCCGKPVDELPPERLARIVTEKPLYEVDFKYVPPMAEGVKTRSESGSAFIDFPVNIMTINPDYRNNPRELAKIIETIDKVRDDKDITITGMTIKGYASPEGSYANNERLAKGRTSSLKEFVRKLYKFPEGFIRTSYDPEDWGGLRRYVENSNLSTKDAILAVIDSDIDPDVKDRKIKTDFPEDYGFLLASVYPALRHSDYTVEYNVRTYHDPVEILKVMKTAPQKLSLDELFTAAKTLEPGTDEYNEVFGVAVRMFPHDKTANLNAANAAMSRKDWKSAGKYLANAGDSAEAEYARGVFAAMQENYDAALSSFRKASSLPEARRAAADLEKYMQAPAEGVILIN